MAAQSTARGLSENRNPKALKPRVKIEDLVDKAVLNIFNSSHSPLFFTVDYWSVINLHGNLVGPHFKRETRAPLLGEYLASKVGRR